MRRHSRNDPQELYGYLISRRLHEGEESMSQLSKDFIERDEFWEDIAEVIWKLGPGLEQDLVVKLTFMRDQESVEDLNEKANDFTDSINACSDRRLLSESQIENLICLFEDTLAIEVGVFQVVEIYNENEDTVH